MKIGWWRHPAPEGKCKRRSLLSTRTLEDLDGEDVASGTRPRGTVPGPGLGNDGQESG